jgi:rhodanese-related sulfurtransferase
MVSRGCENVYNLRGGIMAWLRDGQAAAAIDMVN